MSIVVFFALAPAASAEDDPLAFVPRPLKPCEVGQICTNRYGLKFKIGPSGEVLFILKDDILAHDTIGCKDVNNFLAIDTTKTRRKENGDYQITVLPGRGRDLKPGDCIMLMAGDRVRPRFSQTFLPGELPPQFPDPQRYVCAKLLDGGNVTITFPYDRDCYLIPVAAFSEATQRQIDLMELSRPVGQ